MKKRIICIVAMLFCVFIQAQDLPQIVPVSPEAASLGKYGEIPVNLATGKINYTVPLYTIEVNGFQWPIYLSYNYNGLIVGQDPPKTGLGWDLIAGGRITRQVRGLPDERGGSANINYKKNTIVPYLQNGTQPPNLLELYTNIANNLFDGQNDKYHINAGNLSGSYVYNEDNNVVFLNHRNYKVNGTTITDENGVKYYFNQSEMGDFNVNAPEGSTTDLIPVSYLLTKIELSNNKGVINFEYDTTINYDKDIVSESEVFSLAFPDGLNVNTETKLIRFTPLKKIIFPNGEVHFDNSTALDNGKTTVALDKISVWNNNIEILNYDLSYSDATKKMKVLTSIQKSSNNQSLPFYDFEYHSFPTSIDYRSQDFWGFYNGKSNQYLINGDREIDSIKTLSGALKKIQYPTKGSTEITYEQNRIVSYSYNNNANCSYSHNKLITGGLIGDGNGSIQNLDTIIKVPTNQIVRIEARVEIGNGSHNNMMSAEAAIEIKTMGSVCDKGPISINKSIVGDDVGCEFNPGGNPCPPPYDDDDVTGFAKDGAIHIKGHVESYNGQLAQISYKIHYEDRVNEDKFIGGLRVKETKDCAGDCSNSNDNIVTQYKYINTDNTGSGNLLGADAIFYYYTYHAELGVYGYKFNKSTNSLQNFSSYQSAPVLYDRVEIIKNGGINGKVINYYSKFGNQGTTAQNGLTTLPVLELESNDWKNGKLIKKEFYKKQEGLFVKQKDEENIYAEFFPYGENNNSTLKAYNFDVGRVHYIITQTTGPSGQSIHDYNEKNTLELPKAYLQTKTISKEYFPTGNFEKETNYEYDIPSLLIKKQKVTSSSGETIETYSLYPKDATILGYDPLTASELNAVNKLKTQNRISEPIQVETTVKNGAILLSKNTIRTNYKDWGNDIVLPDSIQTSKGSNALDTRIVYSNYDDKGNPLQVSKKDGTQIVYIWGYNKTQPIAKIENATYSEVQNQVSNLQNLSNLDDDRCLDSQNCDEKNLRTALMTLRNSLPNAQVTTFTYDPLIGVTSITDPRGQTIYYHYDSFNRLKHVKDKEGNILSENEYNYKN